MTSTLLQPLAEAYVPVLPVQLNPITRVLNGTLGAGILLRGHDGRRVNGSGSTHYTLDVQNPTAPGRHAAFVLSGTASGAVPSPANSVLLVADTGLLVGAGTGLRLYSTDGTDYASLVPDADGGVVVGGSGANAGDLTAGGDVAAGGAVSAGTTVTAGTDLLAGGNIAFRSGTAHLVVFDHAATAARTLVVQDLTGTVALLGASNAGHLLWVDNTYDIGAAGATRPRDLYLAGSAYVSGALTVSGAASIVGDVTLSGALWTAFTPTSTQGVSIAPTVTRARYRIFGKMVTVLIELAATAAGTSGTRVQVTLPAALLAAHSSFGQPVGTFLVGSAGTYYHGAAVIVGGGTVVVGQAHGLGDRIGAAPAFSLAVGGTVGCQLTYELA